MKEWHRIAAGWLASAWIFVGCASSSVIVTGTPRTPIDVSSVKLYLEAPEKYEVIGQITAYSDSGWTRQGSVDYAIGELKKRAAALGANGVIIKNQGAFITGATVFGSPWSFSGATVSTDQEQFFVGLAIHREEGKGNEK